MALAHALDVITFAVVIQHWTIGGEFGSSMVVAYVAGGMLLVIALKAAGVLALSCLVVWERFPWFARVAFVPAVGAGLVGTLVNAAAYAHIT